MPKPRQIIVEEENLTVDIRSNPPTGAQQGKWGARTVDLTNERIFTDAGSSPEVDYDSSPEHEPHELQYVAGPSPFRDLDRFTKDEVVSMAGAVIALIRGPSKDLHTQAVALNPHMMEFLCRRVPQSWSWPPSRDALLWACSIHVPASQIDGKMTSRYDNGQIKRYRCRAHQARLPEDKRKLIKMILHDLAPRENKEAEAKEVTQTVTDFLHGLNSDVIVDYVPKVVYMASRLMIASCAGHDAVSILTSLPPSLPDITDFVGEVREYVKSSLPPPSGPGKTRVRRDRDDGDQGGGSGKPPRTKRVVKRYTSFSASSDESSSRSDIDMGGKRPRTRKTQHSSASSDASDTPCPISDTSTSGAPSPVVLAEAAVSKFFDVSPTPSPTVAFQAFKSPTTFIARCCWWTPFQAF